MKIWRIILATLVIFGAGLVTGALLIDSPGRPPPPKPAPLTGTQRFINTITNRDNPLPWGLVMQQRNLSDGFLDRLDAELKLSPQQRESIKKIIGEGQEHTKLLCKQELRETKDKIRAELTPEQQVRFAELLKPKNRPPGPTNAPPSHVSPGTPDR